MIFRKWHKISKVKEMGEGVNLPSFMEYIWMIMLISIISEPKLKKQIYAESLQ